MLSWIYLGHNVKYQAAVNLQKILVSMKHESSALVPDMLLFLQHAPVYTSGRRGPFNGKSLPNMEDVEKFEAQLEGFKKLGADYIQVCSFFIIFPLVSQYFIT